MRALNIVFIMVVAFVLCAFAVRRSPDLSPPATQGHSQVVATQQAGTNVEIATLQNSSGNAATTASDAHSVNPQNAPQPDKNNLPSTSSALPLISVIGFGVLVGGIASALKTR